MPRKWLLCGILLLLFSACRQNTEGKQDSLPKAQGTEDPSDQDLASSTDDGFVPVRPRRVRVMNALPRFALLDQTGKPFQSNRLSGKVWVATFFFTRCTATCPEQIGAMKELQSSLKELGDLRFVSITVDPEYDKPQVLSNYAKRANADTRTWSFLTGKRQFIRELSEKGFKLPLNDAESGPIAHSQNFVLVDRARRIRGFYDALRESDLVRLREDINLVLNDPPGAIVERKSREQSSQPGPVIYEPREILSPPWLEERAAAQRALMKDAPIFHDFEFTDHYPESGITFVNRVVEDAAKNYKGVHYDHGNGVAVADVDGDGKLDIYFVNQVGANQLCRNLGDGRFEDITVAAGVAVADRIGVTASFADTDNDGDQDLFVTTVRDGNLLFENDGTGSFRDISQAAGVDYRGHSSAAVFFDFDNDGLLDLFVCNPGVYTSNQRGADHYYIGFEDAFTGHLRPERVERSLLYRNLGDNKFQDVSEATGLVDESWTGDATPVDLNGDGWQDLYVLSMQGHDEYYENQGGNTFARKSRELFPRTSWGAMGIKAFDFNNDSKLDLYITDMHTDMVDEALQQRRLWHAEKMKMTDVLSTRYLNTDGNHVAGNSLFQNRGNGAFREVSEELGVENYWPWGVSAGDLNADGWLDLFVTASMNYPYRYAVNSVLLNHQGREFLDSEFVLGVEPRRDGKTCQLWFRLDTNGADRNHPLSKGRSGTLEFWGALGSRSSVIFDLDGDGDLDIVTNDFHSEPMVLISDLSKRQAWLSYLCIELVGTRANRNGLGARVAVTAGGNSYLQVMDGQSGYLSQSVMPLYFGLADSTTVDRVEVVWPGSKTPQIVEGPITINQCLKVTQE